MEYHDAIENDNVNIHFLTWKDAYNILLHGLKKKNIEF